MIQCLLLMHTAFITTKGLFTRVVTAHIGRERSQSVISLEEFSCILQMGKRVLPYLISLHQPTGKREAHNERHEADLSVLSKEVYPCFE